MNEDKKREQSEYLLKWALEEQLKNEGEGDLYLSGQEMEEPHVFSKEHERRMNDIFKMAERTEHAPKRRQRRRRNMQMAAGIAAVFCISTAAVMQSEAIRIPVMNFFTEIKEKSTFFGVDQETYLTEKFQDYEPRYVPEGFAVLQMKEDFDRFSIEYINAETEKRYVFYFYSESVELGVDTENAETEEVQIHGKTAYAVQKGKDIRIVFQIDGKSMYLVGNISLEEAIKVLESVQK